MKFWTSILYLFMVLALISPATAASSAPMQIIDVRIEKGKGSLYEAYTRDLKLQLESLVARTPAFSIEGFMWRIEISPHEWNRLKIKAKVTKTPDWFRGAKRPNLDFTAEGIWDPDVNANALLAIMLEEQHKVSPVKKARY